MKNGTNFVIGDTNKPWCPEAKWRQWINDSSSKTMIQVFQMNLLVTQKAEPGPMATYFNEKKMNSNVYWILDPAIL